MKSILLSVFFCLVTAIGYGQSPEKSTASLIEKFYVADNLDLKLKLFTDLQRHAPDGSLAARSINYDEMRRILALNYLQKDSIDKYQYYIKAIHDKVGLADQLDKMTSHMTASKKMATFAHQPAASLVQLINEIKTKPLVFKPAGFTATEWTKEIKVKEIQYKTRYALILYREESYAESIALLSSVYDQLHVFNLEVFELYAKLLNATGNFRQSTAVANQVFEAGYKTDELMQVVKANYRQTHSSESGLDSYLTHINQLIRTKTKERLKGEMTRMPAPVFSLRNLASNVISLSSLKGKVVVIDFWATWCMPCKESFPAVQRVVDHYADDNKVEFLFIDTWENNEKFESGVRQFITDSKYTFNVLFDERDPVSHKQELTSNAYQVKGIPTRIIVDRNGKICFTEVGYSGSFEQMSDDLITRIELAKKQ